MKDNEKGSLYLYNKTGQLISRKLVNPGLNQTTLTVPDGNYIMKVVTKEHSIVKKLVIN